MSLVLPRGPRRIVCLTEEPTETLYLLGEQDRIVGISAYTVRPPEARRDKPVVSAFTGGSVRKIAALEPDLIIGFSDIQAELAKKLIAANLPVVIFNQRSIQEILEVIVQVGSLVGRRTEALGLAQRYLDRIEAALRRSAERTCRPRVYFEEWPEPTFTGIRWVSELVEVAGGRDVFADRAGGAQARDREVELSEIVERGPEVVLACWCGKPFDGEAFRARPGMAGIPAVQSGRVYEVPPEILLQPGPAALTDGLDFLEDRIHRVVEPPVR